MIAVRGEVRQDDFDSLIEAALPLAQEKLNARREKASDTIFACRHQALGYRSPEEFEQQQSGS